MVELQSLLAEIPRTLNAPEQNSGASRLPELLQHSGLPKPCFPDEGGEPQLCPGAEPEAAQPCPPAEPGPPEPCHGREPEIPEPTSQKQPEVPEACPPVEPASVQACSQGQTGLPGPSPRVEPEASDVCSLEPGSPGSSPQPCCGQWAPATSSVISSSQRPLCASPTTHSLQSLRPPAGQAGKWLVGRGCAQRRSSSHGEQDLCPGPGDPRLAFFHLPCPAWLSFRKMGGAGLQSCAPNWLASWWGDRERAI